MGFGIKEVVEGLVSPVSKFLTKKEETKQAKNAIEGAAALAKQNGDDQVNVAVADWEKTSKAQEPASWKDEYVTVSVFSIWNIIVIGSVVGALGFDQGAQVVDGVLDAINSLNQIDGIVGKLMLLVASAALSVKIVNLFR